MSADRREQQREKTHQEILATARRQMAADGAAALSLRAIARRMGMTAPALYRYFDNRDALVTSLIVVAYQSLRDHLEAARQSVKAQDHYDRLLAVGRAYREWGVQHPEDYALIFGTPIPGYQAPLESTLPIARSSLGVLIQVLEEGWRAGAFVLPADPPAVSSELLENDPTAANAAPLIATALELWALVHGLTSLELFNHFTPLIQDPGELFEQALIHTIRNITKEN